MKTKQNSRFSSSTKVPYKEKSTHESFVTAWFSSSGTQDVSVACRLLLILSVRSHCTQESCLRNPCEVFMWAAIKPSFASLTSVHCHSCRFESKLSASETSMSSPFGKWWLDAYIQKKAQLFAMLSCSGTQDWTADLMIMNKKQGNLWKFTKI